MIENIFSKYNIPLSLLEIPEYSIPNQPKEKYYGNREYKIKISELSPKKLEKRTTQCLFRIHEGDGQAQYFLGIADNGKIVGLTYEELCISIENIIKIVNNADADIYKVKVYSNNFINTNKYNTIDNKATCKYCVFVKLRKTNIEF
jgi:GTPase